VRAGWQAIGNRRLAERLRKATRVVIGTIGTPTRIEGEPRSEHDPLWWRAPIDVRSFEKGPKTKPVFVLFSTNEDFRWADAPKLRAGDSGIYLLQPDTTREERLPGPFLFNPLDALPVSETKRVRQILKGQR
jgi:hypothetical protein